MTMYRLIGWSIVTFIFSTPTQLPQIARDSLMVTVSPSQGPVIEQIMDIAKNNNVPLGVVVRGTDDLCRQTLNLDDKQMSLKTLIQEVNNQLKEYRLTIDSGTVIMIPISAGDNINGLLNTKLAYFRPENATMQGLGEYLWIYIRAAIDPNEGSISSIISNPDSQIISGFHIESPVNVMGVLNHIVQQDSGGVWVVSGLPNNWEKELKSSPIEIRDYSEGIEDVVVNTCQTASNKP